MAWPNSHVREGNVDHFYFRESSGSDNSPESHSPLHGHHPHAGHHHNQRRQSSETNLGWWHKHMQEHAEQVHQEEHEHDAMALDDSTYTPDHRPGEMDTLAEEASEEGTGKAGEDTIMRTDTADLDEMDFTAPPDPMWITTNNRNNHITNRRLSTLRDHGPIGESLMPLVESDNYLALEQRDKAAASASASSRHIGESTMPYIPSAPTGKSADVIFKTSNIPPDTGGFRNQPRAFGRPFGAAGYKPPAPQYQKRRPAPSPPMLGKDLVFRRCPSPKATKLEPDHPFEKRYAEEKQRDHSGNQGLWRGYCFRSDSNDDYLVPADLHAPHMLTTPRPPATPGNVSGFVTPGLTDEPVPINGAANGTAEHRARGGKQKGLHMLHGVHERLQHEKVKSERDEKISQEFDDLFVTQVYNYLSLGYPAMARSFDEELSRISLMSVEALEKDDGARLAQGHLVEAEKDTPREKRCPRWKALRLYIKEWARQHPDLDSMDMQAWGVRERRGSWAI